MAAPKVLDNQVYAWNRQFEVRMDQNEFADLEDLRDFYRQEPLTIPQLFEQLRQMAVPISEADVMIEHGAKHIDDLTVDDVLTSLWTLEDDGTLRSSGHELKEDSTYNWAYYGPVVYFRALEDRNFPLTGIHFSQVYLGGSDVRNILAYGPMEAYWVQDEDNPFLAWELHQDINTDQGRISLMSDGPSTDPWLVYSDETGEIGAEMVSQQSLVQLLDWSHLKAPHRGRKMFKERGIDGFPGTSRRRRGEFHNRMLERARQARAHGR